MDFFKSLHIYTVDNIITNMYTILNKNKNYEVIAKLANIEKKYTLCVIPNDYIFYLELSYLFKSSSV